MALMSLVAVIALVLALVAVSRVNALIESRTHRAYVHNVLRAVEVRGEFDRQERTR